MNIQWLNNIFKWIEIKSKSKYYVIYLTVILVCVSLFFAMPKLLFYGTKTFEETSWKAVMLKSQNLLDPLTSFDADSHAAKKVFRLTVPLIIKVFHLNPLATYILQFVIGFFLIILIYRLSEKLLKDSVSSTFLTAGLVFLYFGKACFVDIGSWFDGWAYFFLILAMLNKNLFVVFIFSTLAAWTDERAFIALPIIILFHQLNDDNTGSFNFKKIISFNLSSIGAIASMVLYLLLRFYLIFHYKINTPSTDANLTVLIFNIPNAGFAAWSFLEGFWLLLILGLGYAFVNKNYFFLTSIALQTLVFIIVSLCVYDVTRSGSYLVPIVFVLIKYLRSFVEKQDFKVVLFGCMIISFIFPAYYIIGSLNMFQPLYFEFFYFINNHL